ncbi:hypothetical protein Pla163_30710 [Planctomycetes bacterium Pla163]|uniref:SLA1 homology domain-containing protein n=1 Tax=Rohdeia mirabilis TaxID=2528008 RepID=A0A518D398_9BACT|nr:hypothetical protein Pla163_30710 [Planctomycetes bacterium Pla163]
MRTLHAPLIALWIACSSFATVDAASVSTEPVRGLATVAETDAVPSGWTVKADDNIVGLSDAKTLSNPARVDYDSLLRATDEMKKLKKDRIDPTSPEGIQLTNAARQRVQSACQVIMDQEGHCSVWKAISHADGRSVPDITAVVKRQL